MFDRTATILFEGVRMINIMIEGRLKHTIESADTKFTVIERAYSKQ